MVYKRVLLHVGSVVAHARACWSAHIGRLRGAHDGPR